MRNAILCFLKEGDSLLLLKTKYPDKTVLNGISGYIDEGETAREAACREANEEVGIEINPGDLYQLGTHDIFTVFITEHWSGEPNPQEESILETNWYPADSLPYEQMHPGNQSWLPQMLESYES